MKSGSVDKHIDKRFSSKKVVGNRKKVLCTYLHNRSGTCLECIQQWRPCDTTKDIECQKSECVLCNSARIMSCDYAAWNLAPACKSQEICKKWSITPFGVDIILRPIHVEWISQSSILFRKWLRDQIEIQSQCNTTYVLLMIRLGWSFHTTIWTSASTS